VRAWALLEGRAYATPADVELLFLPVLGHRLLLTPTALAEARRTGWSRAFADLRDACLRLAPPPQLTWDDGAPLGD
jgi:MoxR-like ATPase